MRADRLAVAAPADLPHRRNDLLHLALQQQVTLLGAPPAARFRTPVFAQGRDLSEVLHRMIKVQQFMHLLSSQAERLHQEWDPLPYPRRPIGDKEHLVRLGDLESLQVGAQQGKHRIRPLERRVNHGSKAGLTLALGIHHIDDQHLGFTPCPGIASGALFWSWDPVWSHAAEGDHHRC